MTSKFRGDAETTERALSMVSFVKGTMLNRVQADSGYLSESEVAWLWHRFGSELLATETRGVRHVTNRQLTRGFCAVRPN